MTSESKTAPIDTMNFEQVKAALVSESDSKSDGNTPPAIEDEKKVVSMDPSRLLTEMPRRNSTRDYFLTPKLKALKEKADFEASLPPKRIQLVESRRIRKALGVLLYMDDDDDPKSIFEVIIRWPQKYCSSKEDLSRSASSLSFSPVLALQFFPSFLPSIYHQLKGLEHS